MLVGAGDDKAEEVKLYASIVVALLLAGFATYGLHVWRKAERVEVAEKALVIERQQHKADIAGIKKSLADSQAARLRLVSDMNGISARFNKPPPPPKTLIREVKVPNETCSRFGLSDDFVVRYNAASD